MGGGTDLFTVTVSDFGSIDFEYLRGTDFVGNRTSGAFLGLACVFGVPTTTDDEVPTSDVVYSHVTVTGVAFRIDGTTGLVTATFDLGDSSATFTYIADNDSIMNSEIDLRGREILANGDLSDTVVEFATDGFGQSSLDTELGADNVLRGSFQGNFQFNGMMAAGPQIIGWFYGPQGVEAGYAYVIRQPDANGSDELIFVGQVLAKQ